MAEKVADVEKTEASNWLLWSSPSQVSAPERSGEGGGGREVMLRAGPSSCVPTCGFPAAWFVGCFSNGAAEALVHTPLASDCSA